MNNDNFLCKDELIKAMFKNLPANIILVDENLNIVKNNKNITVLLNIKIENNKRFGNALKCINSIKNPKGCGFSKNCKTCLLRNTVLKTFKTNKIYKKIKFTHKLINNDEFSFELTTLPINNDNRKYVLIYLNDITEEKKKEISILNLNNFLLSILDADILWIEITDAAGTILLWSKLCEILTGYKAEEVVGKKKTDFFHPYFKYIKGEFSTIHFIQNKKSLKLKEINLQKKLIKNYKKEIIGYLIVGSDISAATEFKNKYYEENKFLNTILQNIQAIILILNNDNTIKTANKFTQERTGYSLNEVKGMHIKNFIIDAKIPDKFTNLMRIFHPNTKYESRIKTKDGGKILISWQYNYILNNDGEVENIIITGEDITEQKEFEKKINTIQRMEAIGRLSGGLAHDFNNILTAIINSGELILKNMPPDFNFESELKLIINTAKKGSVITKQLLGFSRQQIIAPKVINLNEYLKNIKQLLMKVIGENIKITLNLSENVNPIKIDETQLEQIILNLCINSKDAIISSGKIIIETENINLTGEHIKRHPEMKEGNYVVLSISDNGKGIEKNIINHIFEPFFTTKPKNKGSGLGLSMVYGIVKQNNGFIYIYSEPKVGTTVKIYFPITKSKREKTSLPAKKRHITNLKGTETILLVEDENSVRKVVDKILKSNGYKVFTAATPKVALDIMKKQGSSIDLIITDIIMPNMNGVELYNKISKTNKNVKVLYMSGYSDKILAEDNVISENINFIQKPFNIESILIKVKEILDNKK